MRRAGSALAVLVGLGLVWRIVACPIARNFTGREPPEFDAPRWRSEGRLAERWFTSCLCDRSAMADDLLARGALSGMTRAQIQDLLGAGERGLPFGEDDGTHTYFLSYFLGDEEWLVVQFDPHDRVSWARRSGGD